MASLLDDQHGSAHPLQPLRTPSPPLPNKLEGNVRVHASVGGPGFSGKCAQASENFLSTFS